MKYLFSLFIFISLSAQALEIKANEEYITAIDIEGCDDFNMIRSENPSIKAWLLGPKIVFFDPGFKSQEKSNCMVTKETIAKESKWIQMTKSFDCEDIELAYSRVEKLEQNKKGDLIYTSEITYDNQKDQVQKLSCRYKKKAVKN